MDERFRWTIPNILSVYRLCISPVILIILLCGWSSAFTVLLIISLVTDILDGFIARQFNMQTKIGAKLDSIADTVTVLLALSGMYRFRYNELGDYILPFYILIGFYLLVYIISAIKFKKVSSLHLYSAKVTGYAQDIFFFVLFCFHFYAWLFIIVFSISMLSYIEEIVAILLMPEMVSDAKGIYWILKKKA